jgi:uncharacterized membrane protein
MRTLTIAAAVGAGINGGVFFAFSTFVMKALRDLPARDGLMAMQKINKAAPSPLFMIALFGTAGLSIVVGIDGLRHWHDPGGPARALAAGCFLLGIALTVAYHVPRNNALAALDPNAAGSGAAWTRYASAWTGWNHVRTLASIASAVLFTASFDP